MLIHLPLHKMAAISQTTFSNTFLWMKVFVFLSIFHLSLFLRVTLITFQHWFRLIIWTNDDTVQRPIYAALGGDELTLGNGYVKSPNNHTYQLGVNSNYYTNDHIITLYYENTGKQCKTQNWFIRVNWIIGTHHWSDNNHQKAMSNIMVNR